MSRVIFFGTLYLGLILGPASGYLPIVDEQHAKIVRVLKWVLPFVLVRETNAALNRLAENRWQIGRRGAAWFWKQEIAVVTGGSGGIGARVAKELAKHGVRVAVLDVVPLSDVYTAEDRNHISFYQCDVSDRDEVRKAGEAIRSELGTPSILINNAGIGNAVPILELSAERVKKTFGVNAISSWFTVQEFLPGMIAMQKGHIMSVASLAAFIGLAGTVEYCATKSALMAFHEGLAQELKHRYNAPEIKTSIIYPNWTRTAMTAPIAKGIAKRSGLAEPEYVAKKIVDQILSKRSGQIVLGPGLAPSIRAFPMWLQQLLADWQSVIVKLDSPVAEASAEPSKT